MIRSSKASVELTISSEIGSKQRYENNYARPSWPGGRSGVTVGIGYDLGYTTPENIKADFGPLLPSAMVVAMQNVAGLKGAQAASGLITVRSRVLIPWQVAMKVFLDVDLPRYEDMLIRSCPRAVELPGDCFGALTSLVYNRGDGGFHSPDDRFREMRAIRDAIASGNFSEIPAQIRSMKRLWGDAQRGLITRREQEAKLFEQGLINKTGTLPDFLGKKKPVTPGGNEGYDVQVETVQRNLVMMNYHEVGDIDGHFGSKTRSAITAFMIDRGKDPGNGELTPEVYTEISAAISETWTRPISEKRSKATAKDIAKKVPTVDSTWWQKLWAYVLGLPSATGAVFKYIFGDQQKIADYVDPVKNFFASIPTELYFVAVAAIALAILIQAKRVQDATVEAYQRGKIN